jgi:isoleucyl-tRNA synthetase
MAPIIPFQTEAIWQKLIRIAQPDEALSVHMAAWPQPLPSVADDGLLEQTAIAREVIAAALRLRNEAQIKVRQPLQSLFVACGEEAGAALVRFEPQLRGELNVKEMIFIESAQELQDAYVTLNFKIAGAILKGRVNEFKEHLQTLELAARVRQGGMIQVEGWGEFPADMFLLQTRTKPGIVSTTCSNDEITVALDTAVTEELRREGAVRDVIRQIQTMRKDAGYDVAQRIQLAILTPSCFLQVALEEACEHLMAEVLADHLGKGEALAAPELTRELDIAGDPVEIQIAK